MDKTNYREVYLILNKLGKNYIDKIPNKIYNYIVENMETQNTKKIIIRKETIAFIAFLHYKYWTESDEEKQEIMKILNDNKKVQEEKNSIDNIFKTQKKHNEKQQEYIQANTAMQIIKPKKWYTNILNIFKKLFRIGDKNN